MSGTNTVGSKDQTKTAMSPEEEQQMQKDMMQCLANLLNQAPKGGVTATDI